MTTETSCLSSIWQTDEQVESWYRIHGHPEDYRRMEPGDVCWYDGIVEVDLNRVEPMIALPFHPSNVWPISELNRNALEILREVEADGNRLMENPNLVFRLTDKLIGGRLKVDQGTVVGCAGGTFDNIVAMAEIMNGKSTGSGAFALSVYPASQPVFLELIRNRSIEKLMNAGAVIRSPPSAGRASERGTPRPTTPSASGIRRGTFRTGKDRYRRAASWLRLP